MANAAVQGWSVQLGPVRRTGWPLSAAIALQDVSAASGAVRWTAPSVSVELPVWEPTVLRISPLGAQGIAFGDQAASITGGPILVRAPFSGGPVTFDARSLATDSLAASRIQHLSGVLDPLALTLAAENVQPSPNLAAPFDAGFQLSARLLTNHPFPPGPTPEASARAWQTAGGRIDLSSFDLQWGPLHITGAGSGGLDRHLQPAGQVQITVQGAAPMLDALVQARLVQPGPASAARAVLQILTLGARGGPVPVPITLADNILTVAGFPLARTAALDWSAP
jgi:hypothetical protein